MRHATLMVLISLSLVTSCLLVNADDSIADAPHGWSAAAPRDERRPEFAYDANAGHDGGEALIIEREGLDGYWTRTYPVQGGQHYRFQAFRQTSDEKTACRSSLVRLIWQDDKGSLVENDRGVVADYLRGIANAYALASVATVTRR